MNRTDLEQEIVRELRAEAGRAPDAAQLKRRLLQLTEASDSIEPPAGRRAAGPRAWTVPLLAAAAAVLVALGLVAVTGVARRSHQVGPATPTTTAAPQPTPTPTRSSSPATSGSPRPTASSSRTPARPTSTPAGWFSGVTLDSLGSILGCSPNAPGSTAIDRKTVAIAGETTPLGVALVQCSSSPASRSQRVFVYRKASPRPVLVQVLGRPVGVELVSVQSVTVGAGGIRLAEFSRVSEGAPGFAFQQQFSWAAGRGLFTGGDLQTAPALCKQADLFVETSPLSSLSGDARGVNVIYHNISSGSCTMAGYPTVTAVDAAGHVLVRATRLPSGFFGGLGAGQPIPTVSVAGSAAASAIVEWSAASYATTDVCAQVAHLVVTSPDGVWTTSVGSPMRLCQLQVHPVVSGSTGKQG